MKTVMIPQLKEMKLKDDCISQNFIFRKFQKEKYKKILSLVKKEGVALDVGCGNGVFTMNLSQFFKKVIGIDSDDLLKMEKGGKTALDMARYLIKIYNLKNVFLKKGNIYNTYFKNNYFDTIFCIEVLEHLNNQEKAFQEIRRILKPKGDFVFSVPNTEGIKFIIKNRILKLLNVYESKEHFSFNWRLCIKAASKYFKIKKIMFYPMNASFLSLSVIVLAKKEKIG